MSELPPQIDTSKPHAARIYDYFLGGKNHFAADREVAEKSLASIPSGRIGAREQRAFLGRAVRYLVAEAGVRQFLDIGTGLPTTDNVHEVAQAIVPSVRVVYVDNDPLVLAHARALLTSSEEGRTAYIHADLRSPDEILSSPVVREVLDFSQPVALMLVGILHFLEDRDEPERIIDTLLDASIFREWVVNVGRRDSRARIAHLLCELVFRLDKIGDGRDGIFDFPLTQEQIADATGLTAVHTNRTLKSLRKDGLIQLSAKSLSVLDWDRLSEVADFDELYLHQQV